MIYLINTKTKEHIDAMTLGDSRYEQFARSPGWVVQMADADGWIEWPGGECPLPDGFRCDVIHRSGFSSLNRPAGGWAWGRDYEGDDIIAYRPILDAGEPDPPAWDGSGPTPGSQWIVNGEGGGEVEYVATIEGAALVRDVESGYFYGSTVPLAELRPIRSEEDKAVEEMRSLLNDTFKAPNKKPSRIELCRAIYRAIRDGKVPGVKLTGGE